MTKIQTLRALLKNKIPHEPVPARGKIKTLRNQLRNYESGKFDRAPLRPAILEIVGQIEAARKSG